MKLSNYTDLIKQLPYKQQCFETSKETWKEFKDDPVFKTFYEKTFVSETKIISRGDLLNTTKNNFDEKIFSIVLWGYPRGYTRGNTMGKLFPLLISALPLLKKDLTTTSNLNQDDLKRILKDAKGIGLSTLTKFFYFFNLTIEGNKCVIFDSRILNVIKGRKFDELNSLELNYKSENTYVAYLELMNSLSLKYGYEVDQLELFLFMFGSNLKGE